MVPIASAADAKTHELSLPDTLFHATEGVICGKFPVVHSRRTTLAAGISDEEMSHATVH
jgi:hypothetical protein